MRNHYKIILFIIGLCFSSYYFFSQPILTTNNGRIADAEFYYSMAEQVARGDAIATGKPFVYRVGLPILVGKLHPQDIEFSFKALNFLFGILTIFVLIEFFCLLFWDKFIVYTLTILFLTNYFSPVRLSAFYPGHVDPPFMLISLLILYFSFKWESLDVWKTLLLSSLAFVGVLFRETTLLAPVAGIFAHSIQINRVGSLLYIPSKKQLLMGGTADTGGMPGYCRNASAGYTDRGQPCVPRLFLFLTRPIIPLEKTR